MNPGFRNLQQVERGQRLGEDRGGDILSSESGRILMPLYQNQGNDGFFIVREVRPLWLTMAAWARRFRLDRLLVFMPGVQRHPTLRDTWIVNRRIARWFVIESFHLLGFRRKRSERGQLLVSRRRESPVK